MKKRTFDIIYAFVFTLTVLTIGYISFGVWTTLIFTSGFLGGFILWIVFPSEPSFNAIKIPYWIAFFLFLVHRVEEKVAGFFQALSDITKVPVPEITSIPIILLVVTSVGAWLLVPILINRRYTFGYYLAWTFFAAMGITELAHFILPLFQPTAYGYFPGMISVVFLAPVAWWGMWRLTLKNRSHL